MKIDGANVELFFVSDVLKLPSLHYGYWDEPSTVPGAMLSLDEIRHAQGRYTHTLLHVIPPQVQSVLDVGCGLGDNARAMLARGLQVTALSPDPNHRRYFEDRLALRLAFYGSTFEELNIDQVFDLVLMSESQNYFAADIGLRQAWRYLGPGGYLLIAGMFRKQAAGAFGKIRNVTAEYVDKATRQGVTLVYSRDIMPYVLPTIETLHAIRLQHLEPDGVGAAVSARGDAAEVEGAAMAVPHAAPEAEQTAGAVHGADRPHVICPARQIFDLALSGAIPGNGIRREGHQYYYPRRGHRLGKRRRATQAPLNRGQKGASRCRLFPFRSFLEQKD